MALPDAVQAGKRPSPLITWTDLDGDALDLTGATVTGTITDSYNTSRAITGTLTVVTAASGIFRWDYSTADVATAGKFTVQFSASYGASPTPAKTFKETWRVL